MKKLYAFVLSLTLLSGTVKCQNLLAIPDTLSGTSFNLNILDTSKTFYPGYTTTTFGINTNYLGPTLLLNKGDSISINVNNMLMDTTTIHWHGMHVSAANDGGPHNTIAPGTTWNPKFVVRDYASMFWYHPHLHMMTNLHATLGAAGLVIVRDSAEAALTLPRKYGIDDFPLVIQSKCFDANKQIIVGNASDSVIMINGTLNAYLPTPAQVVRFRLLNASSERVYNFGFQGNLTFYQIGTDGGLLNAPVSLTRLKLAPGERADILIDLSGKNGQTINLMSFASELPNATYGAAQPGMMAGQTIPGYSSNPLNGNNFSLMTLNVVAPTANAIFTIPASLITNTPWSVASANANRTLTFSPVNMGTTALQGAFLINNTSFDMNVTNYTIPFDNIEVWTLSNQSPIAHPFHIHDIQFYITQVNGATPPANMQGRKDVVLVPANQTVKFITKFETFCDSVSQYMYHCHMLPHEDDGMMGQFKVVCPATGIDNSSVSAEELFNVYPNPATDQITVSYTSNELISKINLYNSIGQLVIAKEDLNDNKVNLELSGMQQGLYFIEVFTGEKYFTRKITVAKD